MVDCFGVCVEFAILVAGFLVWITLGYFGFNVGSGFLCWLECGWLLSVLASVFFICCDGCFPLFCGYFAFDFYLFPVFWVVLLLFYVCFGLTDGLCFLSFVFVA